MMVRHRSVADYCSLQVLVLDRVHGKLHMNQEVSTVLLNVSLYLLRTQAVQSSSQSGKVIGCLALGFLSLWKCFVGEDEATSG